MLSAMECTSEEVSEDDFAFSIVTPVANALGFTLAAVAVVVAAECVNPGINLHALMLLLLFVSRGKGAPFPLVVELLSKSWM